jgi:hypothetical protein
LCGFFSLSFLLEKEENHCLQEKHHCHHHAVVIEAELSEEQDELQRIDRVPDEILLPTPRREQREQQFHEHCPMMDALRHSIHSLAFILKVSTIEALCSTQKSNHPSGSTEQLNYDTKSVLQTADYVPQQALQLTRNQSLHGCLFLQHEC